MGAWEFNGNQWLKIEQSESASDFNPSPTVTVEAMCHLLERGDNPTILCRPYRSVWTEPEILWRLGFYADTCKPEFQLLFQGESSPTVVRSEIAIPLHETIHLAGVYDGEWLKLYVNGAVVCSVAKQGQPAVSVEPVVIGARSATDLGGYLVGRLFDVRYWKVARSADDIAYWHNKTLPFPVPDQGCVGYWHTEQRLELETMNGLLAKGFSSKDISFLDFIYRYAWEYPEEARRSLLPAIQELYPPSVHTTVAIKLSDGYLVFYEPERTEYVDRFVAGANSDFKEEGFLVLHPPDSTLAQSIQGLTNNVVKMISVQKRHRGARRWKIPRDQPDAVTWMLHKDLVEIGDREFRIHVDVAAVLPASGSDTAGNKRIRIIAPLVQLPDGRLIRAFTWLFADLWFGEPSWNIAAKGLAEVLVLADVLDLNQLPAPLSVSSPRLEVQPAPPLLHLERRVRDFKSLIEKDDVDEVRDVLPFLARPEHWFLLNPKCDMVWPEKKLGHKWQVDFIVREPTNVYTAIEIESPTKRIYKAGNIVEPFAELTHAEQQVRDYCNFIDRNIDYIEREEGLTSIFKPSGLVVIGRRDSLTPEGAKKLAERNAENSRYTILTFDDLIDQANALLQRLNASL